MGHLGLLACVCISNYFKMIETAFHLENLHVKNTFVALLQPTCTNLYHPVQMVLPVAIDTFILCGG